MRNIVVEKNGDLKILENCWTTFQCCWTLKLNITKITIFNCNIIFNTDKTKLLNTV